jgi:GNAT superfamily N-acetyltransferase
LTGTAFAGISLRIATAEDALAISLLIESVAHHFYALPSGAGAERFKLSVTPEKIAQTVSKPNFIYCVAEHAGAIVGAVGIRDTTHLLHLFVAPAYQAQGIGKMLWEKASLMAIEFGNTTGFTVNASVNAIPVYLKFGFQPVGEQTASAGIIFQAMRLTLPK